MNLRHLEYLRLIIDLQSFGQAAKAAKVSQPAITYAMRALQQQLGLVLFVRKGKRMVPTSDALALAEAGQSLERTTAALKAPARSASKAASQAVLRVGMSPAAGLLYGPLIFSTLKEHSPDCVFHMEAGHAPGMLLRLARGFLDLVVAPQPRRRQNQGLEQHDLYVSKPFICCRVGHPLARASTLDQLSGASWVVAGDAGTPGNQIEEAFRVRRLPAPKVAAQCSDYLMLQRLVAQSDLLGVISHPALLQHGHEDRLQSLSIREGLPHYAVCLFWRADDSPRVDSLARQAVVRTLIEHAARTS